MHISNPATGFMEKLNNEFKKSRLSKVTGHDILPPPPPSPPSVKQIPPPPPPVEAPVHSESAEMKEHTAKGLVSGEK